MSPSRTPQRLLLGLAFAGMLAVIALSLVVAPDAANFAAPLTHRIFYYHVPSAWVAYLAFGVTAVASARYLLSRDARQDRLAAASAEVGLLFSSIALLTGVLWSRVEFSNYSALGDAKVVTLLVLMLAYLAYLALRSGVEDAAKRGRLAAVFGLVSVVAVPLSYLASKVSIHPDFTRPEQSLAPELGMILGASVLAFTALYAALVQHRARLLALADDLAALRAAARGPQEGA